MRLVFTSTLGPMPLRVGEHGKRLVVRRARIAHRVRQPSHRLDVLREYFETAVDHRFDVARDALEIRCQRFDGRRGIQLA
jgi:hypothetical protein